MIFSNTSGPVNIIMAKDAANLGGKMLNYVLASTDNNTEKVVFQPATGAAS